MNERERLIELLKSPHKAEQLRASGIRILREENDYPEALIADFLLANGVIVPPCKVGDTVYRVMADKRITRPYEYKVIGFWYSADETCNDLHLVRSVNGMFDHSISVPFSEFNRILFSTQAEAEKALAERMHSNERT